MEDDQEWKPGLPEPETVEGLRKFAEERLACGPTLVCPLAVIWSEYVKFCDEEDVSGVPPDYFSAWMCTFPDVTIEEGGRGIHKKCLNGLGFRPRRD